MRAGDGAGDRFGDQTPIGLVEAGHLRRFELKTLIKAHPAQRAGVGAAQGGVARGRPNDARLRRNLIIGFLIRQERGIPEVLRKIKPVIGHPRANQQWVKHLPILVGIKIEPLQVGDEALRDGRAVNRQGVCS